MQLNLTHFFFAACLNGLLSAYLAHRQGRNLYRWFALGFLFGLIGVFAVLLMPQRKKEAPLPVPVPTLQGPTNKLWYYVSGSHEQVGPISHNALSNLWKSGALELTTYVWNEELTEWKPLQEFVQEFVACPK